MDKPTGTKIIEGGRDAQVKTAVVAAMTYVCHGDITSQQQCLEIDKILSRRGKLSAVQASPGSPESPAHR
jgi:hypothetical protein